METPGRGKCSGSETRVYFRHFPVRRQEMGEEDKKRTRDGGCQHEESSIRLEDSQLQHLPGTIPESGRGEAITAEVMGPAGAFYSLADGVIFHRSKES